MGLFLKKERNARTPAAADSATPSGETTVMSAGRVGGHLRSHSMVTEKIFKDCFSTYHAILSKFLVERGHLSHGGRDIVYERRARPQPPTHPQADM